MGSVPIFGEFTVIFERSVVNLLCKWSRARVLISLSGFAVYWLDAGNETLGCGVIDEEEGFDYDHHQMETAKKNYSFGACFTRDLCFVFCSTV